MDKSGISFRPSMMGHELADAIGSLEGGLASYAQDLALEGDEFVIHLRKPTVVEKMKMALMPKAMQRERMTILCDVIREAAKGAGVDGDQLLADITAGRTLQASNVMRDAGVRVALRNAVHHDFF